jgi:hypothetical protein
MKDQLLPVVAMLAALLVAGCDGSDPVAAPMVVTLVNSLEDVADPPAGTVTLRSALAAAAPREAIRFDPSLDGGVVELSIVGDEHTVLRGEVMGMRDEPSGPVSYLEGYFERDYGKSALYARKDVTIDASDLLSGITLAWVGSEDARVLAVYGDLEMRNVTVTGGRSTAEDIKADNPDQLWTLGRGGAVAVWGQAHMVDCTLYDNHCIGDFESSRDRGAFGGGLYANIVILENCVVAGNTVLGGGAAGGGVYSVGGALTSATHSRIDGCSVTGNRISAVFTYGAGVYSDGGGIGNLKYLVLTNTTIARNVVEPAPGLPPFLLGMGYWRGGGVYMSNGYLQIHGCTIVENEVSGVPRTDDLGKPNLAGGISATIGNAHAVEEMVIGHSIIAGNLVHELGMGGPLNTYNHDIFTGSLLYFRSMGYNRFGVLDFSHILVPVGEPDWKSLCRKHYPKVGDEDGVDVADVLDLAGGVTLSPVLLSAGVGDGDPVVLYYEPAGTARDRIPTATYSVPEVFAEYEIDVGATNDFLEIVLGRIEDHYGLPGFAATCQADFEAFLQSVDTDDETAGLQPYEDPDGNPILTLADTQWFGPALTWPKELPNYPYMEFWHHLDAALRAENIPGMGVELLGDEAWSALFDSGRLDENPEIDMTVITSNRGAPGLLDVDQRGTSRPADALGDIGAIEVD